MIKNKRRYRIIRRTRMKSLRKINYIIIFISIIIIVGAIFIKLGLDSRQNTTLIYSYTAQKSDNYEVLLKPNTFYTSETLPSGGYYAAKSVNAFIIKFKYDFKGNKKTDIEYNYNITAELIGMAKNNDDQYKEIWNRSFTILENKNNKVDTEDFFINEEFNIDYEYYNNLARSYEKTYGITIDSVLKVRLDVSYNINFSNLDVDTETDQDYIELYIPITNTVTECKENYEDMTYKDITIKNEDININEIIYYIIGGLLMTGAIAVIVIRIKNKKNRKTPEEIYNSNINRILKYYRDLIVTVTNEPDLTNLKIMHIAILDDLIDVAEQNQSNIIHYEVVKNEKSMLYVIADGYVYVYVVTDDELK